MAKKKPGIKKKVKNIIVKVRTRAKLGAYYRTYENEKIRDNVIFIESKNGDDLAGNMFAIIKELQKPDYKNFEIYLSVKKEKKEFFDQLLKKNEFTHVKMVRSNCKKYYRLLATAKYLFLDTSFARDYIKRDGQIITNTWHGTPLKLMGKDVTNRVYAMGNVQRNLQMADYLVYPNRHMKDIMFHAYCLDNIYNGTILWSGYPRNSVFFNKKRAEELRKILGFEGKKVYVYMPTWRGTLTDLKSEGQIAELEYLLGKLDKEMDDDMILLAKLHPFVKNAFDLEKFTHIQGFPGEFDSYEVLGAADGLITDYSSVFYDYANARKKIILWAYDVEAYVGERGMYETLESMPFPVVKSVEELVTQMRTGKEYDETAFMEELGYCDNPDAAEYVCKRVLFGEKICKEEKQKHNGKENVLFYVSSLAKNGITTSIMSLLESLDRSDKNYFAVFRERTLARYPLRVETLPEDFAVWPISAEPKLSLKDTLFNYLYFKRNVNTEWVKKHIDAIYERENRRHFVDFPVDYAVHFTGYEKNIIQMFERLPAERSIFVHNDMQQELATKTNQHRLTLEHAYANYDHVAIVSEDLRESTEKLGAAENNLLVVPNCFSYRTVREKGEKRLEFQDATVMNVPEEEFRMMLDGNSTKFINIGRFSAEKGHGMLIEAFDEYHEDHPETKLIIIGGYGKLYADTVKLAGNAKAAGDIYIIKQMENPMPILKRCDLFLLSSLYEGFGLVLLEADALGVPIVSTNIVGPGRFMKEHHGYMVEPTKEGLLSAMNACAQGKIKSIQVDYEAYNQNAVNQFKKVMGKGKVK